MMEGVNHLFLKIADPVLNPLLFLPTDLVLFILAIGTAVLVLLIRKMTTDQDFLRRCKLDCVRLNSRLKEARLTKNTRDVSRFKAVLGTIGFRAMKQEGLPLLVALLPIALLASWAFARLGYHAPAGDEWVKIEFSMPASEIAKFIHLIPQDGLEVQEGWIREVEKEDDSQNLSGTASWTVRAPNGTGGLPLIFRLGEKKFEHAFMAGAGIYSKPSNSWEDGEYSLRQKLRSYRPFGLIPGFDDLFFPAWLVGYLIVVIPAVPLLKKLMRVF